MSLRRMTWIFTAVLAAVVAVAAGELVIITTHLHQLTARMGVNMESVRAAEEIELALLWHSRASFLHMHVGNALYAEREHDALQNLKRWQEVARHHVGEPAEERILQDLNAKIVAYLTQHQRLGEASESPVDLYTHSAPFLLDAYNTAEALI